MVSIASKMLKCVKSYKKMIFTFHFCCLFCFFATKPSPTDDFMRAGARISVQTSDQNTSLNGALYRITPCHAKIADSSFAGACER